MAEETIGDQTLDNTPAADDVLLVELADGSDYFKTEIVAGLGSHLIVAAGKSGGQTIIGGTGSGDDLLLQSTSHGTKGHVAIDATDTFIVDCVNDRVGIGVAAPAGPLEIRNQENFTLYGLTSFAAIRLSNDFNNMGIFSWGAIAGNSGMIALIPFEGAHGYLTIANNLDLYGTGDMLFQAIPFGNNNNGSSGYSVYEGFAGLGLVISSYSFNGGRGEISFAPQRVEKARISPDGNLGIGATSFGSSATYTVCIASGTVPGSSPTDRAQMYAADYAAGECCMHFRDEAGDIIKLRQQKKASYNNWATLGDLLDALAAMGIIDAA